MPQLNGAGGLDRAGAEAIAGELLSLTTQLEALAAELGRDPATLRRHMESLQAIDLVGQVHRALADILRGAGPLESRLEAVPLDSLRHRLLAAALGEPPPN